MAKNMFDLDDSLLESKKEYTEDLKKANVYCMREHFDKALEIYNKILDDDMENMEALIGLLKVHSKYFTKYDGEEIEKDIRVIERMFPDIMDEEYAKYCLERKKYLESNNNSKKVETVKEKEKSVKKDIPAVINDNDEIYTKKFKDSVSLFVSNEFSKALKLLKEVTDGYEKNMFDNKKVSKAVGFNNVAVACYYRMALCCQKILDNSNAIRYFGLAKTLATLKDVDYYGIYYCIGNVHFNNKNYELAIDSYLVAFGSGKYESDYYKLAWSYDKLKKYELAKKAYERFLFNDNNIGKINYGWAWYSYGNLYYYGEGVPVNKTKAKEMFRNAVKYGYENAKKYI